MAARKRIFTKPTQRLDLTAGFQHSGSRAMAAAAAEWKGHAMLAAAKFAAIVGLAFLAAAWSRAADADDAKVVDVKVAAEPGGTFRFAVTLGHADHGWAHYANKFEVLTTDGQVLGTRVLLHPHDDEQPFTRDLSGVKVPAGVDRVVVRAWDNVHKAGTRTMTVALPPRR
jgi:hypothetical protein